MRAWRVWAFRRSSRLVPDAVLDGAELMSTSVPAAFVSRFGHGDGSALFGGSGTAGRAIFENNDQASL